MLRYQTVITSPLHTPDVDLQGLLYRPTLLLQMVEMGTHGVGIQWDEVLYFAREQTGCWKRLNLDDVT